MFDYAIALSGGIATGKSTACSLLKLHGFLIIDADKIAHSLLDENSSKIAKMFGDEFVENGKVLRKNLGKLIFSNKEEKKRLEEFIHPLIQKSIEKESKIFEEQKKPYFIDIPLFFETDSYKIEKSVVIYTPKDLQITRLMQRDGIDEKEAILKISNQMDIEEKREKATFVVDNSKGIKELQEEVEKLKEKVLR